MGDVLVGVLGKLVAFAGKVFGVDEADAVDWCQRHKLAFSVFLTAALVVVAFLCMYLWNRELVHSIGIFVSSRYTPVWISFVFLLWLLILTHRIYAVQRSSVVGGVGGEGAEPAGVEVPAEVHDVIVELTSNSLNLLNVALEAVWPSSQGPVVLKGPDAKSAERACEELKLANILSVWHVDETESGSVVELVLHRRLQSISKAKMLKMVNREIVRRATRGRWVDHL